MLIKFSSSPVKMSVSACFRGGGVGCKSTRHATNFFKKDRNDSEESEKVEMSSEVDIARGG